MIEIKFNGKVETIDDNCSIGSFLRSKNIISQSVISVVNSCVINLNKIDETILKDRDELEIVRVVAGG
ncbi:MAG: sulfur carrier protein ThiS [Elusimicrobiota bacterium]|nr:sulfur carrier protein ThiS [Elusimicrobiota bacterium]